jgi:hypothetical protein
MLDENKKHYDEKDFEIWKKRLKPFRAVIVVARIDLSHRLFQLYIKNNQLVQTGPFPGVN